MGTLPLRIQLLSILGVVVFMFIIIRLIIRGRLKEEYSVVWLFCAVVFLVFSIWRKGFEQIALFLGVYYPPSLIFLFGFFALVMFSVHLSIVVSKLQAQVKTLAHEIAFLKKELAKQDEPTNKTSEL